MMAAAPPGPQWNMAYASPGYPAFPGFPQGPPPGMGYPMNPMMMAEPGASPARQAEQGRPPARQAAQWHPDVSAAEACAALGIVPWDPSEGYAAPESATLLGFSPGEGDPVEQVEFSVRDSINQRPQYELPGENEAKEGLVDDESDTLFIDN